MTDREQIIKDFEHAVNKARGDYYDYVDLTVEDADKILKLLKEQEATIKAQQFVLNNVCEKLKEQKIAMKPKNIDKIGGNCPVCGLRMARSCKYCYQCGQEMNWNA